jgi:hypothetical protein
LAVMGKLDTGPTIRTQSFIWLTLQRMFLVCDQLHFGVLAGLPDIARGEKSRVPICPVSCRSVSLQKTCDTGVRRSCIIEREDSYGGHIQGERRPGNG